MHEIKAIFTSLESHPNKSTVTYLKQTGQLEEEEGIQT
jgi:hypothetical protein